MIKLENTEIFGWEASIRGCRNPMNSWEKSDSGWKETTTEFDEDDIPTVVLSHYDVGPNDHDLMMRLAKAGSVDAKYRRMIVVSVDITAPLYWWKEFDTYKVGTVANSCSTMHKIHSKKFTLDDFSCEHLIEETDKDKVHDGMKYEFVEDGLGVLRIIIETLNRYRSKFLETKDKIYWWHDFCDWIKSLPYSEIITLEEV